MIELDTPKTIKIPSNKIRVINEEEKCDEPNWKEECIKLQRENYKLNRIIAGLHYALWKCVPESDKE